MLGFSARRMVLWSTKRFLASGWHSFFCAGGKQRKGEEDREGQNGAEGGVLRVGPSLGAGWRHQQALLLNPMLPPKPNNPTYCRFSCSITGAD